MIRLEVEELDIKELLFKIANTNDFNEKEKKLLMDLLIKEYGIKEVSIRENFELSRVVMGSEYCRCCGSKG